MGNQSTNVGMESMGRNLGFTSHSVGFETYIASIFYGRSRVSNEEMRNNWKYKRLEIVVVRIKAKLNPTSGPKVGTSNVGFRGRNNY